ncbi:MAG: response regulator [Candidatus Synoicihabitans palmerolidicus]|nr:response regulator [Candidatus Synoicihabitans palmerolidicus]
MEIDEPPPQANALSGRRHWICSTISDTGGGIPPDQLEQVWTPFFTTKTDGNGTGLGLSTVRSLVVAHGGFINLNSEVHRGTTFAIHLPAIEEPAAPASRHSDHKLPNLGHGERILVVDDEPAVRAVIRETLGSCGYHIVLAADGVEALATMNLSSEDFAWVITDVHMPHMAGDILVNVLKRLHPQMPVLAISGHPDAYKTWKADQQAQPTARFEAPSWSNWCMSCCPPHHHHPSHLLDKSGHTDAPKRPSISPSASVDVARAGPEIGSPPASRRSRKNRPAL